MKGLRIVATLLLISGGVQLALGDADLTDWAVTAELSVRQIEKDPTDQKAYAALVKAWLAGGDLKRAESTLMTWRSKVRHPLPMIDRLQGDLANAGGDLTGAIEAWKRFTRAVPDGAAGWERLAGAQEQLADFKGAIESMGMACKTASEGSKASRFARRAILKVRIHDWEGAAADAQEGNRIDATDHEILAIFPIFERMAAWKPKVEALTAEIAKDPNNSQVLLDRAEVLLGEGLGKAGEDDVEAACKVTPSSLRARLWKEAFTWEQEDRREKERAGSVMPISIDRLQEVSARLRELENERDPEVRAAFLLQIDQPLLALEEVAALDGSPARTVACHTLGRLPEARASARRAVGVHPGDSGAWLMLGRIEMENGNMKEAVAAFDRSLKIRRTDEARDLRKAALSRQR